LPSSGGRLVDVFALTAKMVGEILSIQAKTDKSKCAEQKVIHFKWIKPARGE